MLISVMGVSAIAHADSNQPYTYKGKQILVPDRKPTNRPNAPSRVFIECAYGEGFIELSFPAGVETIDAAIYAGESPVWVGQLTADEPSAEIPTLNGEHVITCTSDLEQTFSGLLYF